MKAKRASRIPFFVLVTALMAVLAAPLGADDWEDARRDKLEEAVRTLEIAEIAKQQGEQVRNGLVSLRHGMVTLVADLARVDLTLEILNASTAPMEWRRSFRIDPLAEVIGASLARGADPAITAQTLTLADARRIYGEIRSPRPTRTRPARRRGGDPLRVERPTRDRIDVVVWPIAPGETVRIALDFVTPLRGRGDQRTYVDPIQGDLGSGSPPQQAVTTEPDIRDTQILAAMDVHWVFDTGDLVLAGTPTGMVPAGAAGGRLHFREAEGRDRVADPSLPLRIPRPTHTAFAVPSGSIGTRVAVWHFDPIAFLEEHDLTSEVSPDSRLRLVRRPGSTSRIAPWTFDVTDGPRPVTARLLRRSPDLHYAVEVVGPKGNVLHVVEIRRPVVRTRLDRDREGAITGWHRAALAARVIQWAGSKKVRQQQALDFAVDLGVLTAGTAALAVPENERRGLSRRSRSQYAQDGAPLGAQRREADLESPPPRSTSR